MLRRLLREPLVHFMLIGAMLFALYDFTAKDSTAPQGNEIQISAREIDELRAQWMQQQGSEPNEQTLNELIESAIYQEVMLREALRLGLDKNDTIVRRRLVQKMEFLSANLSQLSLPDENALLAYFDEHKEKYRVDEKRSFRHIYFSRDRRGEKLLDDARAVLVNLETGAPTGAQVELGDNFILQYVYKRQDQRQLARVFGEQFSERLFELEAGQWQGPVVSEYGAHLVRVEEVKETYVPALADIKDKVLDEYMQEQLNELKQRTYMDMRNRYQVKIDAGQERRP